MTTMTTPLSPAPRYPTPVRPRFKTNPSQGVPYVRQSSSRDVVRRGSRDTGKGKQASTAGPIRQVHAPIVPIEPVGMEVDAPTPSPAITSEMHEFPLPPVRSVGPNVDVVSPSSHATTITPRPLPRRPGPPPPELIPEWEPDTKAHIPADATLDARIASYSRLSAPPPRLRSQVMAREQGVTREYGMDAGVGVGSSSSNNTGPVLPERERLGRIRQPAVNGLVRTERRARVDGAASGKGKGKMREQVAGFVSDLSGIAGEWTLDPGIPRGNEMAGNASSRPSLASGSRTSFATSDQGHSSVAGSGSMEWQPENVSSVSSRWKSRNRPLVDGSAPAPATAVFETDKGNIDVRLAVVDSGTSTGGIVPEMGDTLTERYVHGERRGLLNARGPSEVQGGETVARVEVVTRKGNVRVELAELQAGRQVALHVTSRDGNVFISMQVPGVPPTAFADIPRSPEAFNGSIQCSTAPSQQVLLLPSLKARVETLHHDRGESLFYLGQRQAGPHPPVFPSRRLSDRLHRRTSSQQTALDSSPMSLPNASRISASSSTTFIPRSATPSQGADPGPTSSIYASSYSGSICIGLYGLEPKGVFHGATTLRGLVEGLGRNAGL